MNDSLTTVHDAMTDAQLTEPFGANDENQRLIQCTFRVSRETKDVVDDICRQHGVTLSTWLRKCCEGLMHDYVCPQAGE